MNEPMYLLSAMVIFQPATLTSRNSSPPTQPAVWGLTARTVVSDSMTPLRLGPTAGKGGKVICTERWALGVCSNGEHPGYGHIWVSTYYIWLISMVTMPGKHIVSPMVYFLWDVDAIMWIWPLHPGCWRCWRSKGCSGVSKSSILDARGM